VPSDALVCQHKPTTTTVLVGRRVRRECINSCDGPMAIAALRDVIMAYPSDFVWGAAAAAYQIEGAAREGGRGQCVWDMFGRKDGAVFSGHTGDVACDHYHRWRDDIGIMKELGLKAYRL